MAYSDVILADSPLAYWRLGEASGNFADSSGNSRTLTAVNTPTYGVTGPAGMGGDKAITLNGTDEYGSVSDAAWMRISGALTLEAWVYRTASATATRGIVGRYSVDGGAYRAYVMAQELTSNKVTFIISDTGAFDSAGRLSSASAIPLNEWVHIACTYVPSTSMRIYVNGSEVAAKTSGVLSAIWSGAGAPLWLGVQYSLSSYGAYFAGSIDEVAIYNSALSAARILAHYNAGISSLSIPVILNHLRQQGICA